MVNDGINELELSGGVDGNSSFCAVPKLINVKTCAVLKSRDWKHTEVNGSRFGGFWSFKDKLDARGPHENGGGYAGSV